MPENVNHIGWLAHDDNNKVVTLYAATYDTPKQQTKTLAGYIRRRLIVRTITDQDGAARSWGRTLTEKQLRDIAAPPAYDDDDGSAAQIAAKLVADAR